MSDPSNVYPDPDRMARILAEELPILEDASIRCLAIGSIAGAVHGDVSWPERGSDLDLFMSEMDARRAIPLLVEAGFVPENTPEDWLLKVRKDRVLTDLIFRAAGELVVDRAMFERARPHIIRGVEVPVISAEDYAAMQCFTHSPETPSHWFNALGVLRHARIDWDYFVRRAALRPARALALLAYARSDGIRVPAEAIDALTARFEEQDLDRAREAAG